LIFVISLFGCSPALDARGRRPAPLCTPLLGVVFTSDGSQNKEVDTRTGMQTRFCVSFIAQWWRNGSFQRQLCFQFSNRSFFRSSPVVMNFKWKNTINRTNDRDGIFEKSSRCDTSWQRAKVWNP